MKRILGLGPARVYTECDLRSLPPLGDIAPLQVREMDMELADEVGLWLEVHNDAFGRNWGRAEYDRSMAHHEHLEVVESYFLMEQGEAVGAASLAVFKRRRDIGVCHYLGVRQKAQARGFGRFLTLYRYHRAQELGLSSCECETTLRHEKSIRIHLDCGAAIKPRADPWNTPSWAYRPGQLLGGYRLRRLRRHAESER